MFTDLIQSTPATVDLFLKAALSSSDTLKGWSLDDRDPKIIEALLPFYGWFYKYYFKVTTDGWEHIPQDKNALLIGSHNGGLAAPDAIMIAYDWFQRFGTERLVYALMEPKIWRFFPGVGRLAAQVGAIVSYPTIALAALQKGASLLIYPGGLQDVFRPHFLRNTIYFSGHKGFIQLSLREEVPIIPIVSHGAHSTLFVLADIYPLMKLLHQTELPWLLGLDLGVFPIYLGLPWGISFGPWPNIPLPTKIHTRVCKPIIFDRYGNDAAHDKDYVNECYQKVCQLMQADLDQLVYEKEKLH